MTALEVTLVVLKSRKTIHQFYFCGFYSGESHILSEVRRAPANHIARNKHTDEDLELYKHKRELGDIKNTMT